LLSRLPQAPLSRLFPYTTLFRSLLKLLAVNVEHLLGKFPTLGEAEDALRAHRVHEHAERRDGKTVAIYPAQRVGDGRDQVGATADRKSTRLNSSHGSISYAVFCL